MKEYNFCNNCGLLLFNISGLKITVSSIVSFRTISFISDCCKPADVNALYILSSIFTTSFCISLFSINVFILRKHHCRCQ